MGDLKNKTIEFLSALDGYHEILKTIHWSTNNNSMHLLTDEMNGEILSMQDRIAECAMGCLNSKFEIGSLKSLLPSQKNIDGVLNELEEDIENLKNEYGSSNKYSGLINILDDFMEKLSSWKYKKTLE